MDKTEKESGKAAWGTYSKIFWSFYKSTERTLIKKFPETKNAMNAQKTFLNRMNDKHIYDVRITRRRNVLYLEKIGVKKK